MDNKNRIKLMTCLMVTTDNVPTITNFDVEYNNKKVTPSFYLLEGRTTEEILSKLSGHAKELLKAYNENEKEKN